MHEVAEISRKWKAEGEPYCDHSDTEKERYDLGPDTGDRACLRCGTAWGRNQPTPAPVGNR